MAAAVAVADGNPEVVDGLAEAADGLGAAVRTHSTKSSLIRVTTNLSFRRLEPRRRRR